MRVCALLFILVMISGCTSYKYFQFSSDPVSLEYGEVGGGVIPNWRFSGPLSEVYGNPYNLQISFQTTVENNSPASVKNIKILNENSEVLYEFQGGEMNTQWSDYFDKWVSHWGPAKPNDELTLDHKTLVLEFDLIFKINGSETVEHIKKPITPIFKQDESSNVISDVLMSV